MMGHREQLRNGDEWDYFNRYSRRMLKSPPDLRLIKRRFGKRVRKDAKQELAERIDEL